MADGDNSEPPTKKRTSALTPVLYNTDKWIEENKQFFLPPVCNKMMHNDGQMKVFYVGGPNERKDFHIEDGEELFYMLKGDMVLKVVEMGKHRDIPIKEGEIFLLPARIPHSPQRKADTVGLVIERERDETEKDGLRYFVEKDGKLTTESLYEEWFHCEDLSVQLAPIIKRFFGSEQYKTGKPKPGTIPKNPPIKLNSTIALEDPFDLRRWVKENRSQLDKEGSIPVFGDQYQFQATVYGKGKNKDKCDVAETFIWQLEGTSTVTVEGKEYTLEENDTLLVRAGQQYVAKRPEGSVSLICYQDPTRKSLTKSD
ncbi:3-hydroxyanthranilate 3,4-dioxygenase-like [Littorina saxatilis]|uniref:3-hydroxyanthranilate 3,4-dioxygenase n=1 Tax=Littorina saxatilis TaxID=31220 RepID=A0AAN9GC35_9CAEN